MLLTLSRLPSNDQKVTYWFRPSDFINRIRLEHQAIGYFNQSLTGYQNINGTEQYYGPEKRFTGFQFGVAFPLWFRPHTARISAAQTQTKAAASRAQVIEKELRTQYEAAVGQYTKFKTSLAYYESNALPTADLILRNAQKAFQAGEIGYVEYLNGLNRVLTVRADYLHLMYQYNQSVTEVEFLMGKNQ